MDAKVQQQKAEVEIPSGLPVGAVIGKGGSVQKALQRKHSVWSRVDADRRIVVLKGSDAAIDDAQQELAELFGRLQVQDAEKRLFRVAVEGGPDHLWAFEYSLPPVVGNPWLSGHSYVLNRLPARAFADQVLPDAWIRELTGEFVRKTAQELDQMSERAPIRLTASLGRLYFRLKAVDSGASLFWDQLQGLTIHDDFISRWANTCDQSKPAVGKLIQVLETQRSSEEAKNVHVLNVHVKSQTSTCQLKYILEDGRWELAKYRTGKRVAATYDIILEGDVAFRLHAETADPVSDQDFVDAAQRHLEIMLPRSGEPFGTSVTLGDDAPEDWSIELTSIKSTVKIKHEELWFKLSFLDPEKTALQLKCQLFDEETGQGLPVGKEALELIANMRSILEAPATP